MSSKKKNTKTYIVLQGGGYRQPHTIGRFRVGAKNPKDAEDILRNHLGKHTTVRTYYEVTNKEELLNYGEIIREV